MVVRSAGECKGGLTAAALGSRRCCCRDPPGLPRYPRALLQTEWLPVRSQVPRRGQPGQVRLPRAPPVWPVSPPQEAESARPLSWSAESRLRERPSRSLEQRRRLIELRKLRPPEFANPFRDVLHRLLLRTTNGPVFWPRPPTPPGGDGCETVTSAFNGTIQITLQASGGIERHRNQGCRQQHRRLLWRRRHRRFETHRLEYFGWGLTRQSHIQRQNLAETIDFSGSLSGGVITGRLTFTDNLTTATKTQFGTASVRVTLR